MTVKLKMSEYRSTSFCQFGDMYVGRPGTPVAVTATSWAASLSRPRVESLTEILIVRRILTDLIPAAFSIPLRAGRATDARHYPPSQPSGRLFVFAHGAGAGQTHAFMVSVADGLAARGVDVVTFDFSYMHERRPVPDRAPALESCFETVIEAARGRKGLADRRLFIGGKSMGGRMATHLGARGMAGLEGIVALGYPLHPPGKPDQLRVAHLSSLAVPILVVQGERDAFGTPAELAPFLRGMPAGATLHVVEGGDHSLTARGRRAPDQLARVSDVVAGWMNGVADGRTVGC